MMMTRTCELFWATDLALTLLTRATERHRPLGRPNGVDGGERSGEHESKWLERHEMTTEYISENVFISFHCSFLVVVA